VISAPDMQVFVTNVVALVRLVQASLVKIVLFTAMQAYALHAH